MWQYQTQEPVRSSPEVWGDLLFVGSDDGTIYAFDRQTGTEVWRYRTAGSIAAGPTVANGRLFVSSIDRRLHAFDLETP
jgi:outer membrane protein assembly factor BamB